MQEKLIFLDTETTGTDPQTDRLCQVSFQVDGRLHTEYFKPPVPMSVKSMSITHITNEMLADKPSFFGSPMSHELASLLGDHVLVAHNAKFDIAVLQAEGIVVPRFICTLRVARYLDTDGIIPEYNLQYLRYYLKLPVAGSAHNAEDDVRVLHALFLRLLAKLILEVETEEKAIERMIEISQTPTLFLKFNFGKYKDRLVRDIAQTDRQYLRWLLDTKREHADQEEDWIYTLEYHLSK